MAEVVVKSENMDKKKDREDSEHTDEDFFEVDQIIGKLKIKGRVLYKVRWKGYGSSDDTWEPKENLDSCQDLIEEYDMKQDQIAKKRAEERKLKQAMMEGRIESSDSSSDSNSTYPSTFKNTFWKDLEAGRVNVFDNDMYSKVKKRSETKDTGSSRNDSDSTEVKNKKKRRTVSNPEKSSSHKSSTTTSHQKSKSTSKKRSAQKWRTENKPESSKRIDFSGIVTDSESETDAVQSTSARTNGTALWKRSELADSSEEGPLKPSLSLVIKKVQENKTDIDEKCSSPKTPSYTVLQSPELADRDVAPQQEDLSKHSSHKKKKKHHKHHKHKSKKASSDGHHGNEKKRKASVTSLTNYPSERSKGSEGKVPRLDSVEKNVDRNTLGLHNVESDNNVRDLRTESIDPCIKHGQLTESKSEKTGSLPKDSLENLNPETKSNAMCVSSDLINSDRSQTCKTSDTLLRRCNDLTLTDKTLSSANADVLAHKASETQSTCDSGIHSPASEKSEVLGRPVGIDEQYLPPLTTQDKLLVKGIPAGQELDIELDELDWDLFDKEVTLQPITITDAEFSEAVKSGDYQRVKQALIGDGKYDLEQPDAGGKTLLMVAVEKGLDDITDLLIENGAKINAQRRDGWTALMMACHSADICTVNLLLDLGARVNMVALDGKTALIIAAMRGNSQILWLLLECGANFNMVTQSGHTALAYLKLFQHADTETILTNHINRVMSEFNKQVSITLNRTARVIRSLFQPQLFNLCEGERFEVPFQHNLLSPNSGVGYLLFIGHAEFANQEVKCRLYGPSAVKLVTLNGSPQACLTEEGNFVLAFSPLVDGRNLLTINTVKSPGSKSASVTSWNTLNDVQWFCDDSICDDWTGKVDSMCLHGSASAVLKLSKQLQSEIDQH